MARIGLVVRGAGSMRVSSRRNSVRLWRKLTSNCRVWWCVGRKRAQKRMYCSQHRLQDARADCCIGVFRSAVGTTERELLKTERLLRALYQSVRSQ